MASANTHSLENPPEFEFVVTNKGAKEVCCLNYVFRLKTAGKRSWNYLCTSHNCTASLSLKAFLLEGENKVSKSFKLERLNLKPKLYGLQPLLVNKVILWIVVLSICVMQHAASNQEIMAAPLTPE